MARRRRADTNERDHYRRAHVYDSWSQLAYSIYTLWREMMRYMAAEIPKRKKKTHLVKYRELYIQMHLEHMLL